MVDIKHPNIIKVLDFGTYENFFFTSFEYFESSNLRQFIRENKLTEEKKKNLIFQLFTGLGFAHQNQIIHRDIKPENILVSDNLELKIGDFGLALSMNDSFVTSQFQIVGTPTYMSPEQICGEKLTPKSDLFSAGIVSYELFTGVNPFLGKDVNETLNNIISFEEEKLIQISTGLPPDIQNLVIGLLHKDPEKRTKDAGAVIDSLSNSSGENKLELLKRNKRIRKIILASSVIIALTVIITLFKFYLSASTGREVIAENKDRVKNGISEIIINVPPHKSSENKNEEVLPVTNLKETDLKTGS